MRYGSVCSGIEAASLAWHSLGWKAKFLAEVEPFPAALLMQRWNATKPKRPLLPEEAESTKDRKTRESWLRVINKLPEGGTLPNLGDFTRIQKEDYDGKIDLLVGGCPCQSYSLAGLRGGLEDPRGNLSLEFVRLAYRSEARWVVFENVPGILSSGNKGSDFAQFLSLLVGWEVPIPEGGWRTSGVCTGAPGCFGVAWRVLDSQYTRVADFPYAVPQRRRRFMLIGYLGDWRRAAQVLHDGEVRQGDPPPQRKTPSSFASDFGSNLKGTGVIRMRSGKPGGGKGPLIGRELSHTLGCNNDQLCFDLRRAERDFLPGIAPTLEASDFKGGKAAISFFPMMLGKGTCPTFECSGTLINGGGLGHGNAVILFDNHNSDRFTEQPETANTVLARYGTGGNTTPVVVHQPAYGFIKNDAGGVGIPEHTEIAPTLRSGALTAVAIPEAIVRRLLPVECERLQGMPDDYTKIRWKGKPIEKCPDAPRYKAIGNSMAINVMRWLGERIQIVENQINDER